MASISEACIMADCQTGQISNTEQFINTMDEATINNYQLQAADLALRLSAGNTDGSAIQVDQPEAVLPDNGDAKDDVLQVSDHNGNKTVIPEPNVDRRLIAASLEEPRCPQPQEPNSEPNITETNQAAHKAVILTLPSPSPIAPQAGDWVTHRPGTQWEARGDYMFYREPGNATQKNSATGDEVEGVVDVFWKPAGYFSWYYPTEQEKEAERCLDKAVWDDGFAFYYSPALEDHPVFHDLVTDQRYYFHKRQLLCDPVKAAVLAVREVYLEMMSQQGKYLHSASMEEVSTERTPSTWPSTTVAEPSPISLSSFEVATPPTEATSPAQQDLPVAYLNEDVVIGVKRPAPVTPEREQPPCKRARTTPSPPTTRKVEVAPSPIFQCPVHHRAFPVFPEDVTVQQRAYMLDLCDIKQEPLIRDRLPELVYKVLFDKTEAKSKPKSPVQTSLTTAAAQVATPSRTRTPSGATGSTGGSQENPISLDTPEPQKFSTPRVGTATNPIPIELGIADEDVVTISPTGSSTSQTLSTTLSSVPSSWPVTLRRDSAPSPEPFMPRVTRSAEKKTVAHPRRDGFSFYKTDNKALLRYQLVDKDPGVVPGTYLPDGRQPDRLLIEKFRIDCNNTKGTANNFSPRKATIHPKQTPLHSGDYWDNWLETKQVTPTQPSTGTEAYTAAARQRWVDDAPRSSSQPALLRGFPMVEMVTFLRANNRQDEGNCYWNALSLQMYGRSDFGLRVKLEHLRHVEAVLQNPRHPRHESYTKINARFFQTNAEGLSGGRFIANMWQILHLPGSWTPSWMTQITADLYGVFVVLYTLQTEKRLLVTETTTRGAYNSRHIFLLFVDGNHYQPMIPNEYDPSEFRCPRPSKELTRAYVFGDSKRWGDGVTHGWRHDASFGNRVPMPLPVDHNMGATFVDTERLIKAVVEGGTGLWMAKL
ncbi:hypothetical protein MCOR17_004475 [Pyricularia oryzae]|nr:hypothetical protein MCOR17_004475 [Pyricularia oryzae]